MEGFIARNAKQLDICLRLMYAEHVSYVVEIRESNKRKIEYVVRVQADEQRLVELLEKYRILIS